MVFITMVALYTIVPVGTNKVLLHDVECERAFPDEPSSSDYNLGVGIVPTEFARALQEYKIEVYYDDRLVGVGVVSWTQNEVTLVDRPKKVSLVVPGEEIGDTCELGKVRFQAEG